MKCHTNVNCTPPTQFPHEFSYMVAIFSATILNNPICMYVEIKLKNVHNLDYPRRSKRNFLIFLEDAKNL
jgi:hypothetical protein